MPGIREHLDALEDPRRNDWNIEHRLGDILAIALCAVIGGAEGWEDMQTFGTAKENWFTKKLSLSGRGIPSSDTFRRVISRIDPERFGECFLSWVRASVSEIEQDEEHQENLVAIDGKTLRGSYEDGDPKAAVHMVSAWASANEMVLAGLKVDDKSNEITAIPELLALLDLNGCIVTIDAMGCQKEIAKQIREAEADYVLALKGNQGHLHREVREYFAEGKERGFRGGMPVSSFEKSQIDHGRKEVRRCFVSTDVEWLKDYGEWAGLSSIALVEYCRDVYEEDAYEEDAYEEDAYEEDAGFEQRFYISSLARRAEAMLKATRKHWEIENKVHWVLDVSFEEDASRIRRAEGAENFSRLRRMALNLLRQDETAERKSIKGRRKQAGWDHEYLQRLVRL